MGRLDHIVDLAKSAKEDVAAQPDHVLSQLASARGEGELVLGHLKAGFGGEITKTLKAARTTLDARKAAYDALGPTTPFGLRFERFPAGSIERAMVLLNLGNIESTTGCPVACNFCCVNAEPVNAKSQGEIPIGQLTGLMDEMYDLVGELTDGNEKLQIGAIERLPGYMATDSFAHTAIIQFLEYLARKNVSKVSLATALPNKGMEAFKVVAHDLWMRYGVQRLNDLDSRLSRLRASLNRSFPAFAELPIKEVMERLEHYSRVLQLGPIIDALLVQLEYGEGIKSFTPDISVKISDFPQTTRLKLPEGARFIFDEVGINLTEQSLFEILEKLRTYGQNCLSRTGSDEPWNTIEAAFSVNRRRSERITTLRMESQQKIDDAIDAGQDPMAIDYSAENERLNRQVETDIPMPPVFRVLRIGVGSMNNYQSLLRGVEPYLRACGLPDISALEKNPERARLIQAAVAELTKGLRAFPKTINLRVSLHKKDEARVADLLAGEFDFTHETRSADRGFRPSRIGRAYREGGFAFNGGGTFKDGMLLTPTALESFVRVTTQSLDCTSGLLRVPFDRFLDEPVPSTHGTHLIDLLPHVVTCMSERGIGNDFIFVFDGINVRKIDFDKSACTVVADTVIGGPVRTLDDVRRLFKYRGTLMEECATCTGCFGLVPKRS